MVLPMRHCAQTAAILFSKLIKKNYCTRGGSGPSVTSSLFYTPTSNNYLIHMSTFFQNENGLNNDAMDEKKRKFCLEQD